MKINAIETKYNIGDRFYTESFSGKAIIHINITSIEIHKSQNNNEIYIYYTLANKSGEDFVSDGNKI